jgi:hypothetical protein
MRIISFASENGDEILHPSTRDAQPFDLSLQQSPVALQV